MFKWFLRLIVYNLKSQLFRLRDSFKYPLVSVIVPVFNEEKFIKSCLDGLRRQGYKNFECLIVDDGSTDSSLEIAATFTKQDNRFKILKHSSNRGLAASRNTGLARAQGEYILFLDSDDFLFGFASIWHRVIVLEKAKDRSDIIGSYCGIKPVNESGRSWQLPLTLFRHYEGPTLDFINVGGECPFNVHAPLVRKSAILQFGGFDESMKCGAEDWDLWSRTLRNGYRYIHAGNCGGAYRQKRASMVRTNPDKHLEAAVELIEKTYLPDQVSAVPGAPYHFDRPYFEYVKYLLELRRVIPYASMSYLAGDLSGFRDCLRFLTPNTLTFVALHLEIGSLIDEGIKRLYCQDRSKLKLNANKITRDRSEILNLITARLGKINHSTSETL